MNFTKQGFVAVTGGKIWYGVVGTPKKTPLIVIHGGPGYPHDSLTSLAQLSSDRQVIFYDQLGCGNSEKSADVSLWRVERFVQELQLLISYLSLEQFHLLGHSWGGTIAAEYAIRQSRRLKSVVLASPFVSAPLWEADAKILLNKLPEKIKFILEHRYYFVKQAPREYQIASLEFYKNFLCKMWPFPAEMTAADAKTNYELYNSMWGPEEFLITGSLAEYNLLPRLEQIKVPILLTYGAFDEISTESADKILKNINNGQKKMFEKSAHMAHLEETTLYISTIKQFFK